MAQADSESIINIVLHDVIAIAHNRCSYGWAAQVFKCFAEHGKSSPLVAGAPVEVQPDELQLSSQMQRQAAFDAVPLDPRSCPGPGAKLCTYRRWFSRPAHQVCPVYWEVPMSTAKLQRILRFTWGLICCQLNRAAICACLATGVCVGSVTLELWVMRGTCSWSALLLRISKTSTLHWLQSAQVSWLGLCGPETSPWSAGTSLLASLECRADDRQTL